MVVLTNQTNGHNFISFEQVPNLTAEENLHRNYRKRTIDHDDTIHFTTNQNNTSTILTFAGVAVLIGVSYMLFPPWQRNMRFTLF